MDIKELSEEFDRIWRGTAVIYEDCARSLGMSLSALLVLIAIVDKDGECTQKSVCAHTFLPKQSVNAIVTGLLQEGYITLTEVAADRRNKRIKLTKKGKAYARNIVSKIHRAEYQALENMTEEQRAGLLEGFREFGVNFHNAMRKYFTLK